MLTTPHLDPRIRRTRQLLMQALTELLAEKSFDELSVHDIAERATLSRATFYDHFPDKFALLEFMIGESFHELLHTRLEGSKGTCIEGLRCIILTVCTYLKQLGAHCGKQQRQFEPMVESKIKDQIREILLNSLASHSDRSTTPELAATVASWAIYGTALEWSRTKAQSAEEFADAVLPLITASLELAVGKEAKKRGQVCSPRR